jgi:hypothetical protein
MLFVVKLASAKYLLFNALTDDVAKGRVRNLCQTYINIDARISKNRQFVDHYKPCQGCWLQCNTGLQTGVGVRCSTVMFKFLCCMWLMSCSMCALLVVLLRYMSFVGSVTMVM